MDCVQKKVYVILTSLVPGKTKEERKNVKESNEEEMKISIETNTISSNSLNGNAFKLSVLLFKVSHLCIIFQRVVCEICYHILKKAC